MDNFVHLHCHSNFSLLDGLIKIPDLFNKVKALGQPAIAITDHGNCASIFDAQAVAQKTGIKYIPGCEVYCVPDAKIKSKEERSSETDVSRKHLILLAKNNEGYKRLIKIASWGMTDGFYFRPRIDDSILEKYGTEGLIASSACFVPSNNLDVLTKDGIKNLLDIKAGDYVQSHTGEWRQVIIPTTREYEGNFYTIKTNGLLDFTITENHKLLVLRENTKAITKNCNYFSRWDIDTNKFLPLTKRYCGTYIPEWIEANQLQQGDYLLSIIDTNSKLEEIKQYIFSQRNKFIFDEKSNNIYVRSQDKNYIYNLQNKLQQLLICSWIYDKKDYYELSFFQSKLRQLNENKLHPLNIQEIPFEYDNKLYIRYKITYIDKFYDRKRVYCLNVDQDHSFTINNIISKNCLAGSISQYILRGQYDKAKKKALYYQQLFNGDFYLELMCHLNKQIDANKGLIQLHKDTGIPLIISSDAHYLNKEDKEAHEVLLAVQTRATMDDPKRWKFEPGYYYIMNRAELIQIMKEKHSYISDDILNEAMDNTVKIAEQCNVEFDFSKHYLPKIDPYKELQSNPQLLKEFNIFETRRLAEVAKRNSITIDEAKARLDTSNEMVRFLCIHGYNGLYKQHFIDAKHLSLFLYELDTIISLGFSSYFLILYEIQYFCNQANILVGFSRGCSSKDNKVKTLLKGLINIDQIEKNDQVLGLDNQYHKVLRTYEYDCNENLIQIETENNKQIDGLTKDHKVLGLKKEDYIEGKEYTINDFKWYEIDELDIDDYIIEID